MTILGLVRHGETEWNALGRMQGQTDIALNENGLEQAEALARRLENEEWDHLYASDLSRAFETASLIGEKKGLTVTADRRLREVHFGQWEGTTIEQRLENWGEHWSKVPSGQETKEMIWERTQSFFDEVCKAHPNQRILIVSHGALLGHAIRQLLDAPQDRSEKLQNTAVTIMRRTNDLWVCDRYNCTSHLDL